MTAVNGVPVRDEVTKEEDGDAADTATNNAEQREGFGRELQLTWRDTLPPNNTLVAGQWWGDDAQPQVSIETGVADRMNLQVGDELNLTLAVASLPCRSPAFVRLTGAACNPISL